MWFFFPIEIIWITFKKLPLKGKLEQIYLYTLYIYIYTEILHTLPHFDIYDKG